MPSPCQTCRPQDPKGVPVRSLSQEMVSDKLRVSTQPRDGGISGQQMFCVPSAQQLCGISGCLAEFSLFRQVPEIAGTVSLQTRMQVRLFSLPSPLASLW